MRVEIPGGQWADIKPVEELTRADRRAVNAVTYYEVDPAKGRTLITAAVDDDAAAAILERVITDWSFPIHIPANDPKSLDQLSLEQDNALRKAVEPHLIAINGKNAPSKENEGPTKGSGS